VNIRSYSQILIANNITQKIYLIEKGVFIMKTLIFYICLYFVLVQNTYTQDLNLKKDTLEFKLPTEIIITAPRFPILMKENPAATSIISFSQMELTMPKMISLDEALKLVPGVKVDNQWNGENVHLSIRGQGILTETGVRGTAVLLDGLPLSEPSGFTTDLYDVDWTSVNKIEIMRGPSASLYGSNASIGVINIETQDFKNNPLTGSAFLNYGSHNFWKGFGQFGGDAKNIDYRISLSRTASDGFRDHEKFWANNIYGKANINFSSNFQLSPVIGYTQFFNENPEGLNSQMMDSASTQANPDALSFNEFQKTERFFAGTTGKINFGTKQSLSDIKFYAFGKSTAYTEAFPDQIVHDGIVTPGGGVQYTLSTGGNNLIKNKFSIGGDLEFQTINRYSYGNLGNAVEDIGSGKLADEVINQNSYGAFIADRIEFGPKWSALLSARYDNIEYKLTQNQQNPADSAGSGDLKFNKPTFKLGITYLPTENISVFADFGTGFTPPSSSELGANPTNIYGGFNSNLVPATSQGAEIGIRGSVKNNFYFDMTGFYLTTKNDFNRFRVPDRPLETFYSNAGSSERYGAELYLSWKPIKLLTIQVAYTYSHFKYTDIPEGGIPISDTMININGEVASTGGTIQNGNWLPNSPQHQLMTDVIFSPIPELSIGVGSETYSKWYLDGTNLTDNSGFADGYTLFNAKASYRFKVAGTYSEVSIYAKNLSSKLYPAFTEPDPGGFVYHPGPKIEVFGGLKVGL
jgi:iron complex outermembrane receptor protein